MLLIFAHCDTQMSPNMGAHSTGEIQSHLPDVLCKYVIARLWHFLCCVRLAFLAMSCAPYNSFRMCGDLIRLQSLALDFK